MSYVFPAMIIMGIPLSALLQRALERQGRRSIALVVLATFACGITIFSIGGAS